LGSDDDGVLDQFLLILGSDRFDDPGYGGPEAWSDVFNEQISCGWTHVVVSFRVVERWTHGMETKLRPISGHQWFADEPLGAAVNALAVG